MPDIPGANWFKRGAGLVTLPTKPKAAEQLRLQMQRLDSVKEQLQDLQTQFTVLAGVVDTVMDRLYDVQIELEKSDEDK
jgi:hypothetical protein